MNMTEPIYLITKDQYELIKSQLDQILDHLIGDTNSAERKWLSTQDTCDLLQIGRTTLYHYEQNGKLIPSRIGRKLFFNREDIEKLLMKKTG